MCSLHDFVAMGLGVLVTVAVLVAFYWLLRNL